MQSMVYYIWSYPNPSSESKPMIDLVVPS